MCDVFHLNTLSDGERGWNLKKKFDGGCETVTAFNTWEEQQIVSYGVKMRRKEQEEGEVVLFVRQIATFFRTALNKPDFRPVSSL